MDLKRSSLILRRSFREHVFRERILALYTCIPDDPDDRISSGTHRKREIQDWVESCGHLLLLRIPARRLADISCPAKREMQIDSGVYRLCMPSGSPTRHLRRCHPPGPKYAPSDSEVLCSVDLQGGPHSSRSWVTMDLYVLLCYSTFGRPMTARDELGCSESGLQTSAIRCARMGFAPASTMMGYTAHSLPRPTHIAPSVSFGLYDTSTLLRFVSRHACNMI